jgi:hypothetical protein
VLNLKRTDQNLNSTATWGIPIARDHVPKHSCMAHFDQNGYDLTPLEQQYAAVNLCRTQLVRWRSAIKKTWYSADSISGVHLNHADLYERKGYHGDALAQISTYAESVPLIYKLIHMKPKWGIDISIDYVDQHRAYEVFHYEWDDFDYDIVLRQQLKIEQMIQSVDWHDFAHMLWRVRDQWWHLDFATQSQYKCNLLGLEGERFKLIVWNKIDK